MAMTGGSTLQVGVGRADITPPVGIAHAGWGAQSHERAAGVDHEMVVVALWVSDGERTCVVCDLDLGIVSRDEAAELRDRAAEAAGTDPTNVRISYTHTHAGPLGPGEASRIGAGQELVDDYYAGVRAQLVGAVRRARLAARPARVASALGTCDVAVNRRLHVPDGRLVVGENPDGYTDSSVFVVRFDDEDDAPIAAILGYAAHPITLAFQNDHLSPDYPGFARLWHERLTGAPTLFLQGCAGDQMAEFGLTGDRRVPRDLGKRLAAAGASAFLRLRPHVARREFSHVVESGASLGIFREIHSDAHVSPVVGLSEQISLPIRAVESVAEARATSSERLGELARVQDGGSPSAIAGCMFEAKRAEMRLAWSEWLAGRDEASVELQTIRIGDVGLVGFPGEPFARIGVDIRERSPLPATHVGGYANGWHGYVPTADAFTGGGYEVELGSVFAPMAAEVLVRNAVRQLDAVAAVT